MSYTYIFTQDNANHKKENYSELSNKIVPIGPFLIRGNKYWVFNPSIVLDDNGSIIVVSRVSLIVNPICISDTYHTMFTSKETSSVADNYLIQWNEKDSEIKLIEEFNQLSSCYIMCKGPEDPRLFKFRNETWLYFQYRGMIDSHCGHHLVICKLHDKKTIRLQYDRMTNFEKNWSPFEYNNELYFVYQFYPHTILLCDTTSGVCVKKYESTFDSKNKVGGGAPAALITWKNNTYYLGVAHYRDPYKNFFYIFRSEPPFNIISVGEPFSVSTYHIEFCSGLLVDNDTITVSIGINDCNGVMVRFSLQEVMDSLV